MKAVYMITNLINDRSYIGSSKQLEKRIYEHIYASTYKKHKQYNSKLYKDIRKYGIDNFDISILEEIDDDLDLRAREQYYITLLKPYYNNMKSSCMTNREEYLKKYREQHYGKSYYQERDNKLCSYNDEILTFAALRMRFVKAGIEHPSIEAKKYIIAEKVWFVWDDSKIRL